MAKVVVLSGAGISAESGISTFRDSDGLWEEYDVKDVCTIGCLETNRDETIEFYDKRRVELSDKQPNKAHKVLADLKKRYGDDIAIITQNVDDLFEKAGLQPDDVIHLHGELTKLQCQECGIVYDIGYKKTSESFNGKCPSCFSKKVRPFIVMFGEMAPNYAKLYEALQDCELLIVIGTSGQVISTDDLLKYVDKSVLNNLEPNPAIDDTLYSYVFYEKATNAIEKIAKIIDDCFETKKEVYLPVKKDGLWGVVDINGDIVISPQYEWLEVNGYFPKNFFKVIRENEYYNDFEYFFINMSNKQLSDPIPLDKKRIFTPDSTFSENKENMLYALCQDAKAVFYNYNGEKVFATEYDYDERYTLFKDDFMIVNKNGSYGLIDRGVKEVIAPIYTHIILDKKQDDKHYSVAYLYDKDAKEQYIDLQSGYICQRKYDAIYLQDEDLFVVQQNGKWGVIDKKERWLLEPKCTNRIDENPQAFNKKLISLLDYDLGALEDFESFVLSDDYLITCDDDSKIFFLNRDKKQLVLIFDNNLKTFK